MRISDWSSDVCSSDLLVERRRLFEFLLDHQPADEIDAHVEPAHEDERDRRDRQQRRDRERRVAQAHEIDVGVVGNHFQKTHRSGPVRSEEHTSELQSLMRISYAVFCLKKKKNNTKLKHTVYNISSQSATPYIT